MKISKTNLALVAISCAVSIIGLEVLVRVFLVPTNFSPYLEDTPVVPHSKYGYFHRPNYSGVVIRGGSEVAFRTNSLGLRNGEIGNDGGTFDILAVGDSFTVGYGIDETQAWPRRLEKNLNAANKIPRFRVINGGVSGYSLSQIRLLAEDLSEKINPKVVVLGLYPSRYWRLDNPYELFHGHLVPKDKVSRAIAADDGIYFTPFDDEGSRKLYAWMKKNFWLGAYAIDLTVAIDKSVSRDLNEGHIDDEKKLHSLKNELERIAHSVRQNKTHLIVLLVNHQKRDGSFADRETRYNAIVSSKCLELELTCVDLLPKLIEASKGKPVFRLKTNHHWSPKAHDLASEEIARVIISWMTGKGKAKP